MIQCEDSWECMKENEVSRLRAEISRNIRRQKREDVSEYFFYEGVDSDDLIELRQVGCNTFLRAHLANPQVLSLWHPIPFFHFQSRLLMSQNKVLFFVASDPILHFQNRPLMNQNTRKALFFV